MAFHVPEPARVLNGPLPSTADDGNNGVFLIESSEPGWQLLLICSDGLGWEHVSVRAVKGAKHSRIPAWREMSLVKDVCWDGEDVVVQFHPRRSQYVNNHPHVLHLWRPIGIDVLTPPPELVGDLDSVRR